MFTYCTFEMLDKKNFAGKMFFLSIIERKNIFPAKNMY